MNLTMLLEMTADGSPERVALGGRDHGYTAQDLLRVSKRAASLFVAAHIEHVGLVGLNSDAVPISLFGAGFAGLPFAPVNYRLKDEQLRAIVARLAPGIVVVDDEMADRIAGIDDVRLITRTEFLDRARDNDEDFAAPVAGPDEIAVLLFTSGTTGQPKAAVLRHRHLTSYVITTVDFLASGDDEAQLVSVPSYHIAGISAVLSCMYSGRRIVYLPDFEPSTWVDTVRREAVTHAMVVPTMLGRVLRVLEDNDMTLGSLRHVSYGGGRMPRELIERAMRLLPRVNFVNAYGLTETSSTISVLTPDDHREAAASGDPAIRNRLSSVGRPLSTLEVEIRGPDGEVLSAGAVGEVYVRGEQVAGEYLGRSVLTSDGWFPTNDAGYLDRDGFLYLDGRLDDVIVRGAENLSPGEIEAVLQLHPAVAEAAVVGVPDPEWGEAVAAAVVLEHGADASEEELRTWVRDRLRSTKTPEHVQFREEMPYSETGKLLRRVLREEIAGERSRPITTGAGA